MTSYNNLLARKYLLTKLPIRRQWSGKRDEAARDGTRGRGVTLTFRRHCWPLHPSHHPLWSQPVSINCEQQWNMDGHYKTQPTTTHGPRTRGQVLCHHCSLTELCANNRFNSRGAEIAEEFSWAKRCLLIFIISKQEIGSSIRCLFIKLNTALHSEHQNMRGVCLIANIESCKLTQCGEQWANSVGSMIWEQCTGSICRKVGRDNLSCQSYFISISLSAITRGGHRQLLSWVSVFVVIM